MQGSGFRVQGSGFRVQGAACRVQGSGVRVRKPDPGKARSKSGQGECGRTVRFNVKG